MKAEYKRDMNHNYLVLTADKEMDTSSYQVRMLVGNVVPSILKCRVQGVDGRFFIYYDITSKQCCSGLFEDGKLGLQDLQLIFGGFVQVMEEMAEYLLNPGYLVIDPEYMYVDAEKKKLYFCYLPGRHRDVRNQLQELTEYILPKLDHQDGRAVMLGYGVYRRALEDGFHLEHIKEELFQERKEGEKKEEPASQRKEAKALWEDMEKEEEKGDPWEEREEDQILWEEPDKEGMEPETRARHFGGIFAGCAGGVAGFLGIMAAKRLGYLPRVPLEALLAGILAVMGILLLAFWGVKSKRQKAQKRQRRMEKIEKMCRESGQKEEISKDLSGEEGDVGSRDIREKDRIKMPAFENFVPGRRDQTEEQEGGFEETVVLCAGDKSGPPSLVSREPGELATIYLREELTIIGKLENASDVMINLPTVSRIHAKIRCRDGEYYLTDLNSRNGTAVNGQMLLPDQDYCLQDQDQVDFAQARYVFVK